MAKHKAQKFEIVTVSRSQLVNCSYNPRVIDKHARKKLKEGIGKLGLLEPLVWNRRTGNLVGGNQRIGILDDLANGAQDYDLDVAAVDLNNKQERQAAILLNNQSAMGAWNSEKLGEVLSEIGSLDLTGFDAVDVQFIVPNFDLGNAPKFAESGVAKSTAKEIEAIKTRKKHVRREQQTGDAAEFYIVVVFKDFDDRVKFLRDLKLDEDKTYFSGEAFKTLTGISTE